jgi:hypothetical protein
MEIAVQARDSVFTVTGCPVSSVDELVRGLQQEYVQLWWGCERAMPHFDSLYLQNEQKENEKRLDQQVSGLIFELKRVPKTQPERKAWQDRLRPGLAQFASSTIHLEQSQMDFIEHCGILDATLEFARMARKFDPAISAEDIYQAGRNVMTAAFIQLLLDLPVEVTPSIFAYSMLYPYTDNYLDDPAVPGATKRAFNQRFLRRLQGQDVAAANAHEEAINRLVGMIEGQWERARYPQVYDSLLAIHAAQARSLGLVVPGASPYELDVLGVSFEKGGTSVLADGYLVAGNLTVEQARLMFGYGSFTQLMDDLEDIRQDQQEGRMTVFSQTSPRWLLDGVTNRFIHFGRTVLGDFSDFHSPAAPMLEGIMRAVLDPLLIDTISRAGQGYSKEYLRELERHFPFHLAALSSQREKLNRQKIDFGKLIEAMM